MQEAYYYLALSGLLTVLLWVPYILARVQVWGIGTFLNNYPEGFPATEPQPPLWAERAKRAHLNMVETLPAFVAVVAAAGFLVTGDAAAAIGGYAQIFFFARIAHAVVYILGLPFLRTPVYLVSWAMVLLIGYSAVA